MKKTRSGTTRSACPSQRERVAGTGDGLVNSPVNFSRSAACRDVAPNRMFMRIRLRPVTPRSVSSLLYTQGVSGSNPLPLMAPTKGLRQGRLSRDLRWRRNMCKDLDVRGVAALDLRVSIGGEDDGLPPKVADLRRGYWEYP